MCCYSIINIHSVFYPYDPACVDRIREVSKGGRPPEGPKGPGVAFPPKTGYSLG
jgi:hypothetical protein